MSKIFAHAATPATPTPTTASAPPAPTGGEPAAAAASMPPGVASDPAAPAAVASIAAPASEVDVAAILDKLAANSSEDLDWKKSIVDLLKLVGMDSGLSARKELATDLAYTGDESDSATMNVWLHKEVLKKLAENGGKVPSDLLG